MDFFSPSCQSGPFNQQEFGLCDDQNHTRAYVDLDEKNKQSKWIAQVENQKEKDIVFTAIDKCVVQDEEYAGRGRCDGMLTTENLIYLVELKDKQKDWQVHAKEQLESTIQFLQANHSDKLSVFRHKKAFACNRKHPQFVEITTEEKLKFFRAYGFRLDIQARVVVI